MNQEKIAEAFARLKSLKSNLPDGISVKEKYVDEFHHILDLLEQSSGRDLGRFRVPASECKPRVTSANPWRGTVTHSKDNYCERGFLMMKIDAVLGLFELQLSGQQSTIGFHP